MNKHFLMGHFARSFQRLGLQEATHCNWEGSEPRMHVLGNGEPIDGVYHSPELEITSVMHAMTICTYIGKMGDHIL